MNPSPRAALLIAVMAGVTALLRFLPFAVFRKRVPAYVSFLGNALPPAVIGMLVIYCFKDVNLQAPPFGAPEILAGLLVAALQLWKRNALISILGGTAAYMLLTQFVF